MKTPIYTGSGVAIITPFDQNDNVNYEELRNLIEFQIKNGTDAIIVCGTTGETCTLTDDEHKEVMRFTAEVVAKRVPVVAGTGSNDTAYAIELSKYAEEVGCDALLLVTPYYNKSSQRGLVAHFNAIANSVEIPSILYNVPSRTGVSITAETYLELSKNPKINGTKEASGDFSLIANTIALCGDDLHIWSGNDDQVVALMSIGGKGVISVLANVAPKTMKTITETCISGDYKKATAIQSENMNLINNLFSEVNPIPVKTALGEMGYDVGNLRLPLYEMGESNKEKLVNALKNANLM